MSYTKQCKRAQWLRLRGDSVGVSWRLARRFGLSPRSASRVVANRREPCRRCARLSWLAAQSVPVTAAEMSRALGCSPRSARRWLRAWESEHAATSTGQDPQTREELWAVIGTPSLCATQTEAPCPST